MTAPQVVGRYSLHGKLASGGMAAVYLGRLVGPIGFSRTVAIKRMHPHLTEDPEFVSMFLDEARLAARVRHPNVVATLDIVAEAGELFLVMDYVQGETLARLLGTTSKRGKRVPVPVVAAVLSAILLGLHAAHEAKDEQGQPLGIVHRDVSPQNVIVGVDGVARVLDFGVAKAVGRLQSTREGQLKGKLAYMAPEQIRGREATRRTDVYAASVVLWEALAGRRLFRDDNEGALLHRILEDPVQGPGTLATGVPEALDAIVLRGLAREPDDRFATAREMAAAIEAAVPLASASVVGAWVEEMAPGAIAEQAARVLEIESARSEGHTAPEPLTEVSDAALTRVKPAPPDDTTTVSQPSSVSVTTPVSARPAVRRWRLPLAAAAATTLGAVLVIGLLASRRADPALSAPPSASTTPTASGPDADTAPVEPAPSIPADVPSPSSFAPAPASTSPARVTAPTPPAPRKPPPARPPSDKSGILFRDPG